jgi:hypothetical protein
MDLDFDTAGDIEALDKAWLDVVEARDEERRAKATVARREKRLGALVASQVEKRNIRKGKELGVLLGVAPSTVTRMLQGDIRIDSRDLDDLKRHFQKIDMDIIRWKARQAEFQARKEEALGVK